MALMGICSAKTAGLSFEQALSKAKYMESNLSQEDEYRLIMAQGNFLGKAVSTCVNRTGEFSERFTVVVSLDASGHVSDAWYQPENAFVSCFENEMKNKFSFKIENTPFFTAIEYSTQ